MMDLYSILKFLYTFMFVSLLFLYEITRSNLYLHISNHSKYINLYEHFNFETVRDREFDTYYEHHIKVKNSTLALSVK